MDNKTKYLLAEYEALGLEPQKTVLNGIEYVIPSLYVKAAEHKEDGQKAFVRDFFDAQEKDAERYEKHGVDVKTVSWGNGTQTYRMVVPFALRNKKMRDSEVVTYIFNRADRKYKRAVKLTQRLNKAYPNRRLSVDVATDNIRHLRKSYNQYLWQQAKSNARYAALRVGDFFSSGIKLACGNIKGLNAQKLKADARKYATRMLLGTVLTAGIAGGVKLGQNLQEKDDVRGPKIELVKTNQEVAEQNKACFMENVDAIKTLLCFMENFAGEAFPDGKGVMTIGYGCTYTIDEGGNGNREKSPIKKGQTMTMEEANLQKERYLEFRVLPQITELVKVPMDRETMQATASFAYVIGPKAFKKSEYLKALNRGVTGEELGRYLLGFAKDPGVIKRNWFANEVLCGRMKSGDFLTLRAEGCYTSEVEECCVMNGDKVKRDKNGLGTFRTDTRADVLRKARQPRHSVIGECQLVQNLLPQDVVDNVRGDTTYISLPPRDMQLMAQKTK